MWNSYMKRHSTESCMSSHCAYSPVKWWRHSIVQHVRFGPHKPSSHWLYVVCLEPIIGLWRSTSPANCDMDCSIHTDTPYQSVVYSSRVIQLFVSYSTSHITKDFQRSCMYRNILAVVNHRNCFIHVCSMKRYDGVNKFSHT